MNGIICERINLPNNISIHTHSHAQLLLPLNGSIYIETDIYKHFVDESSLFFLPPKCLHAYKGNSNNEFLVLNIPENMVLKDDITKLQGGNKLLFDERWKAIRYLLMSEITKNSSTEAINKLFYYFYHFITENVLPDSVKYINNYYYEDINIKTLADIEHYTVNYYCEWFKSKMKVSPMDYIKKCRIEKAKELLASTDYSILQIAHQVGYSYNSSFSRIFKELVGISPADYRKNLVSAKKHLNFG